MKKILYSLFVALTLGFTFVACDDDDEGRNYANTPEIDAAGVYSGTMTRYCVDDDVTETTTGTLTIAPTDSAYCADFAWTCTGDFVVKEASVANISHADDGFVFENSSTGNGLGVAFSGRIDGSGNVTLQYTIQEGRRPVKTYNYTFTGTRQ